MAVDGINIRSRGKQEEFRGLALDPASVWRMRRLTRDGMAKPVSRDKILRRE